MIFSLAVWELKQRFAGTAFGILWSVIFPLCTIGVYWVVFACGLKVRGPSPGIPYTLWFVVGITPWLSMNEMIISGVNSVSSKRSVVKNVVFPLEILPITSILASQISFFVGLLTVFLLMFVYAISFDLYLFQFFYYFFAMMLFTLGLCYFLSALNVYLKDFAQLVAVLLNIWFWLTPIIWPAKIIPIKFRGLLLYNPLYYIVNGFRETFITHKAFWLTPGPMWFFWILSFILLFLGVHFFKKLKPGFSDVV